MYADDELHLYVVIRWRSGATTTIDRSFFVSRRSRSSDDPYAQSPIEPLPADPPKILGASSRFPHIEVVKKKTVPASRVSSDLTRDSQG